MRFSLIYAPIYFVLNEALCHSNDFSFSGRSSTLPFLSHKGPCNFRVLKQLGPKTHFCLPTIYIIYIFISHLIKEKSGKVGHDAYKRWYYHVFAGPLLFLKTGQRSKKVGQKVFPYVQILAWPK